MSMLDRLANSLIKRTKSVRLLQDEISRIRTTLHSREGIAVRLRNGTQMLLPNALDDFIEGEIARTQYFYESDLLDELKNYIPSQACILDIGANIGNHALYWASHCSNVEIHAFEPVPSTYASLVRNIDLNDLSETIQANNFGLSDTSCSAEIEKFNPTDIGGTVIKEAAEGVLLVKTLDEIWPQGKRIDFIKIDTEGFELKVLRGASDTISREKPRIFIEVFKENIPAVFSELEDMNYELEKSYRSNNYLFKYRG